MTLMLGQGSGELVKVDTRREGSCYAREIIGHASAASFMCKVVNDRGGTHVFSMYILFDRIIYSFTFVRSYISFLMPVMPLVSFYARPPLFVLFPPLTPDAPSSAKFGNPKVPAPAPARSTVIAPS